jgi:GGDEF domain-containing protein
LTKEFDKILENWHGDIVKTVSVSYGYVVSSELKGKSVLEIASLADKRMYEAKEKYYKDRGITRRRT